MADDERYVKRFWDLSRQQIKEKSGFDLVDFEYFLNGDKEKGNSEKESLPLLK